MTAEKCEVLLFFSIFVFSHVGQKCGRFWCVLIFSSFRSEETGTLNVSGGWETEGLADLGKFLIPNMTCTVETCLEPYRRLLFNLPSSENDSDKLIFNSRLLEGCSGTLWPSQEGGSPLPQTPNMFLVYEVGDKLMGAAMLQLECWMLSAQPDAECCNLDAERSMLNGGCHRLDAACGMLDARCCMTHAACWTLDAECWTRLLIASCEISKLL